MIIFINTIATRHFCCFVWNTIPWNTNKIMRRSYVCITCINRWVVIIHILSWFWIPSSIFLIFFNYLGKVVFESKPFPYIVWGSLRGTIRGNQNWVNNNLKMDRLKLTNFYIPSISKRLALVKHSESEIKTVDKYLKKTDEGENLVLPKGIIDSAKQNSKFRETRILLAERILTN